MLVLNISIKIYNLDGTHDISIANSEMLASFATLLYMRQGNMNKTRTFI